VPLAAGDPPRAGLGEIAATGAPGAFPPVRGNGRATLPAGQNPLPLLPMPLRMGWRQKEFPAARTFEAEGQDRTAKEEREDQANGHSRQIEMRMPINPS